MDNEKQVRTVGDAKEPERIPREKSKKSNAKNYDAIDKALEKMNEEPTDDGVTMGDVEKPDLTVVGGK